MENVKSKNIRRQWQPNYVTGCKCLGFHLKSHIVKVTFLSARKPVLQKCCQWTHFTTGWQKTILVHFYFVHPSLMERHILAMGNKILFLCHRQVFFPAAPIEPKYINRKKNIFKILLLQISQGTGKIYFTTIVQEGRNFPL